MRPLRLGIESFTCFKDKQPVIDFGELSLFAISGPTGAGKSSLLDAVLFALYGKVPRLRKNASELISLGRERTSVVLDFGLGAREFRVSRVLRRGRSSEAQLDELTGGIEKPLAGGATSVERTIEKLLGLRYEAFTQAVVLPQGEFARFLRSQPRERREILRDLLRLQVYERMRQSAAEKARGHEAAAVQLEEILSTEYATATEAALVEERGALQALAKKNDELARELETLEARVASLKLSRAKTVELRATREAVRCLAAREAEIKELRARADAAARVEPVLPLIDEVRRAEAQLSSVSSDAARARRETEQAHERQRASLERLQDAARAAAEIPTLRGRLRALDEIKGLLDPRDEARRRLRALEDEIGHDEKDLESLLGRKGSRAGKEAELAQAKKAVNDHGYDASMESRLDAAREDAAALAELRDATGRLHRELEREDRRAHEASREVERLSAAAEKARRHAEEAEERFSQAQEAHRKAEHENAALALRAGLRAHERCPVCEQTVKKLPPAAAPSFMAAFAGQEEEFQEEASRARALAEKSAAAAAEARALETHARKELEATRHEVEEARARVDRSERALEKRAGADVKDEPGADLETRILSAAKRLGERRRKHAEATSARERIERELIQARALQDALDRARVAADEIEKSFAETERRIRSVAGDADPVEERDRLEREHQKREADLERAQDDAQKADLALAVARNQSESYARSETEFRSILEGAIARAQDAAAAAGFPNEEAAERAFLSREERGRIAAEIDAYNKARAVAEQRLSELSTELRDAEVEEETVATTEGALGEARVRHHQGLKNEATLETQIENLRTRIESAKKRSERLKEVRGEYELYQELSQELLGNRFQSYLLEESFAELVEGASHRLMALSGRYTLDYQDDVFYVLDHENAGERRLADTLSGGETFLASLALALELSEQVQRAAGAVNLDSLFIDEGFGGLDSETLDTVSDAIEMLHVGGRMVGIITHLPELTARLPARLIVEKHPSGSRVRQELG